MRHLFGFTPDEKTRHELTLEALADVDAGRTIDHSELRKWVEGIVESARAREPASPTNRD